jgi:hypothetical protein
MKQKIKDKIIEFIGKERPMSVFSFVLRGEELERYMQQKGYNQALADLRSKADTLADEIVKVVEEEKVDTTDNCRIEWVEDGVLGCTYNHKDKELCLDMFCKDCRLYKCTCYDNSK